LVLALPEVGGLPAPHEWRSGTGPYVVVRRGGEHYRVAGPMDQNILGQLTKCPVPNQQGFLVHRSSS
jgi:hypothetical protein